MRRRPRRRARPARTGRRAKEIPTANEARAAARSGWPVGVRERQRRCRAGSAGRCRARRRTGRSPPATARVADPEQREARPLTAPSARQQHAGRAGYRSSSRPPTSRPATHAGDHRRTPRRWRTPGLTRRRGRAARHCPTASGRPRPSRSRSGSSQASQYAAGSRPGAPPSAGASASGLGYPYPARNTASRRRAAATDHERPGRPPAEPAPRRAPTTSGATRPDRGGRGVGLADRGRAGRAVVLGERRDDRR